jgi:hypothetical protein
VRGTTIAHSGAWHQQDAPLLLENGVSLAAGVTLTIDPGVTILMLDNGSMTIDGTLLARGTANAPIVVSSARAKPAPDDWESITFSGPSASGSVLDYLNISYGGYYSDGSAEVVTQKGANPTITHSVFAWSQGDGVYAEDGSQPTIAFNVFQKNLGAAISLPKKDPSRVHDNQLASGQQVIEFRG